MRRVVAAVAAAVGILAVGAAPAFAHPLGNFTANTYAGLFVGPDATRVDYVLDLAEIPAFQARQRLDEDGDGQVDDAEAEGYRDGECGAIARGLVLTVDGARRPLSVAGAMLAFPRGQAGLETLRLECALVGRTGALPERAVVAFTDTTRRDRIGWREVTAAGDHTTLLEHDVTDHTISDRLTAYPEDRLASPLGQTTARLVVDPGRGAPATLPQTLAGVPPAAGLFGAADRWSQSFTGLVARRDLTAGFAVVALAVALGLGTLHALAPGHGKTLMAAYLIGRDGSAGQALLLGLTVAIAHTLGVFGLGVVLSASQSLATERLYPVLGVASGLVFAGVGVTLFRPALARWRGGEHEPGPGDLRHGHGHGQHHGHDHHDHDYAPRSPWRSLVAPGLAGGLVPSPSALLVLLGGFALGRAWFGVVLVLAYGIGMAAALVGAGWLLVRARAGIERRLSGRLARVSRALPLATACLVVAGGVLVAARSALGA